MAGFGQPTQSIHKAQPLDRDLHPPRGFDHHQPNQIVGAIAGAIGVRAHLDARRFRLDRFGRTRFQRWYRYASGNTAFLDEWDYTYDAAGNRLTRDLDSQNVSGAPVNHDQLFDYDGLDRLTTFDQGQLSGGSIASPTHEEDWTLDQLGNWANITETDGTSTTLDQDRYHNAVNEIEGNGGDSIAGTPNWADPVYDAAGNMTTMPQPADPTSTYTLTYDAWNRLVSVGQEPYFEYDGLGRRIVNEDQATSRHYYYNEQWQMLEERVTGYDDRVCQYVWHTYYIDALAVRYYDPGTTGSFDAHYYCQDANFNVTAITDDTGAVLESEQRGQNYLINSSDPFVSQAAHS